MEYAVIGWVWLSLLLLAVAPDAIYNLHAASFHFKLISRIPEPFKQLRLQIPTQSECSPLGISMNHSRYNTKLFALSNQHIFLFSDSLSRTEQKSSGFFPSYEFNWHFLHRATGFNLNICTNRYNVFSCLLHELTHQVAWGWSFLFITPSDSIHRKNNNIFLNSSFRLNQS